ncbi:hypothetical protein ACHAWC_007870 [Mediolabrus comicus]
MSSFPIGSKVMLQNLIKGSQYNGKDGVIKTNPDGNNDERQQVLLRYEHKILCVKPKNMKLLGCGNCGNTTGGDLLQCECDLCKKLKGRTFPTFYCNNSDQCKKSNEEDHNRMQELLLGFTNLLLDAKKKQCAGQDALRMHDGDEDLFKDPPAREECSICFLPAPIDESQWFYQPCCGKDICHGCIHQVNVQTDDCLCPYCRAPVLVSSQTPEMIKRINKRMDVHDCGAFHLLGTIYSKGWYGVEKDMNKAADLWTQGAALGSCKSHFSLAEMYYEGDIDKAKHHLGIAAMGGDVKARAQLGRMELKIVTDTALVEAGIINGVPMRRAIKHFTIAAKMGCEGSMDTITKGYSSYFENYITKNEYEATLRAHQDAKESMKSAQREEAAEWNILQKLCQEMGRTYVKDELISVFGVTGSADA